MEVRPEPIRASRRVPLQLLVAAIVLALAAIAVGASLGRPGALSAAGLTAAAGASASPAASPDASGKPDRKAWGRGFGFPGGVGPGWSGPGAMGRGGILADITVTSIDGTQVSLASANGWKRVIDVAGVAITRAGATIALGDLKVGDRVSVSEQRASDGTYAVKGLTVVLDQTGGTVSKLDAASITVGLGNSKTATITTDGTTVYRRDGQPITRDEITAGDRVIAWGTKDAAGNLTADAVEVQPDVVIGAVTKIDGSTLTISTLGGGTVTVIVTSKTTFSVAGKDPAALGDIAVKDMVVAQGVKDGKGVLTASSVRAGSWRPTMRNGRGWRGQDASPSPAPSAGTSG